MSIENAVSSDNRSAFVDCYERFRLPPIRYGIPIVCTFKNGNAQPDKMAWHLLGRESYYVRM